MSDEIKKDRSPNYPKVPLEQAVEMVAKLYNKVGKAKVKPEVAIGPLGYSGINGASLTTLGTLTTYGLLERERGESVAVSQLAIRLMHPVDEAQGLEARRESALCPKVFSELFSNNYHMMEVETLSKHLIQSGFTQDGARKAASVFKANIEFAKLDKMGSIDTSKMNKEAHRTPSIPIVPLKYEDYQTPPTGPDRVLSYAVPLGRNTLKIEIIGKDDPTLADFDSMGDYVDLFKKQFERKLAQVAAAKQTIKETFPFVAMWKNKDSDKMVTITGLMGDKDGQKYYQSEDGTGIPERELFPNAALTK